MPPTPPTWLQPILHASLQDYPSNRLYVKAQRSSGTSLRASSRLGCLPSVPRVSMPRGRCPGCDPGSAGSPPHPPSLTCFCCVDSQSKEQEGCQERGLQAGHAAVPCPSQVSALAPGQPGLLFIKRWLHPQASATLSHWGARSITLTF